MRRQHAGFTLVEIIVVLTIVALLAAIIVPVFSTSGDRINRQACMNNLHALGVNLTQYRQDYGVYPKAPLPTYLRTVDPKYVPFGYMPTQATCSAMNISMVDELHAVTEFTGSDPESYVVKVKISALGTDGAPDEYLWTDDDWATDHGPFPILDADAKLPINRGINVLFSNKNGHTVGDAWTITLQANLPTDWPQWNNIPPIPIANTPLGAGAIIIDVNKASLVRPVGDPVLEPKWLNIRDQFNNRAAILQNPDGQTELVIIEQLNVNGTFTIYPRRPGAITFVNGSTIALGYFELSYPLTAGDPFYDAYAPNTLPSFISGNFGLARFLQIYGTDTATYHCPQMLNTENVQTGMNLRAATEGSDYSPFIRFDTLSSGYNTYDVTYNYDQYNNAIAYFDARLGYGVLNLKRQLKEAFPPADTVVCWCYGHRPDQTPAYDDIVADVDTQAGVAKAEQSRRNDVALVLWVDGTVTTVTPYIMQGADDAFYRVPPFLYSRGEWLK